MEERLGDKDARRCFNSKYQFRPKCGMGLHLTIKNGRPFFPVKARMSPLDQIGSPDHPPQKNFSRLDRTAKFFLPESTAIKKKKYPIPGRPQPTRQPMPREAPGNHDNL